MRQQICGGLALKAREARAAASGNHQCQLEDCLGPKYQLMMTFQTTPQTGQWKRYPGLSDQTWLLHPENQKTSERQKQAKCNFPAIRHILLLIIKKGNAGQEDQCKDSTPNVGLPHGTRRRRALRCIPQSPSQRNSMLQALALALKLLQTSLHLHSFSLSSQKSPQCL